MGSFLLNSIRLFSFRHLELIFSMNIGQSIICCQSKSWTTFSLFEWICCFSNTPCFHEKTSARFSFIDLRTKITRAIFHATISRVFTKKFPRAFHLRIQEPKLRAQFFMLQFHEFSRNNFRVLFIYGFKNQNYERNFSCCNLTSFLFDDNKQFMKNWIYFLTK